MVFWPTSVATDANLFVAVNSLETTLSSAIDNVVTTIPLTSVVGFPTAGAIAIDLEVIFYTGISGSSLTGCTRGADGTVAASHLILAPVAAAIVAYHHNVLKDEIEALESSLNLTASKALISNVSGRVDVSTVTSTELSYLSGVTSAIQSQLNGKQATLSLSNLTDAGTDGITVTGGTGAVIGSGTSLSQHVADSTHNGYLSSVDWSTFNSKQTSLSFGNLTAGSSKISIGGTGTGAVIGSGVSINIGTLNLDDLSDVTVPSPSSGDILSWNGSAWVNIVNSGGSGVAHLAGIETFTGAKTFLAHTDFSGTFTGITGSNIVQNGLSSTIFSIQNGVTGGGAYSSQLALSVDPSSTGNPFVSFTNTTNSWSIGEDTSTGNFEISNSSTLGTSNVLTIVPATAVATFSGSVKITPTSNQLFLGPVGNFHTIITAPTPALNRTYTIPDAGANASFAMTEGTQTINGVKTFGGQLIGKGTSTNDDATAGYIGEAIRSSVTSAVSSTGTGQWFDITSISLTTGDWDISGQVIFTLNGSTQTVALMAITSTSGNSATGQIDGDNRLPATVPVATNDSSATIANYRVPLASSTTYYLKARCDFSAGTPKAYGRISARRMR